MNCISWLTAEHSFKQRVTKTLLVKASVQISSWENMWRHLHEHACTNNAFHIIMYSGLTLKIWQRIHQRLYMRENWSRKTESEMKIKYFKLTSPNFIFITNLTNKYAKKALQFLCSYLFTFVHSIWKIVTERDQCFWLGLLWQLLAFIWKEIKKNERKLKTSNCASPKQIPVIGQCEVQYLCGGEGSVGHPVRPQGEAQQGDKHGGTVPPRDAVNQDPCVPWKDQNKAVRG